MSSNQQNLDALISMFPNIDSDVIQTIYESSGNNMDTALAGCLEISDPSNSSVIAAENQQFQNSVRNDSIDYQRSTTTPISQLMQDEEFARAIQLALEQEDRDRQRAADRARQFPFQYPSNSSKSPGRVNVSSSTVKGMVESAGPRTEQTNTTQRQRTVSVPKTSITETFTMMSEATKQKVHEIYSKLKTTGKNAKSKIYEYQTIQNKESLLDDDDELVDCRELYNPKFVVNNNQPDMASNLSSQKPDSTISKKGIEAATLTSASTGTPALINFDEDINDNVTKNYIPVPTSVSNNSVRLTIPNRKVSQSMSSPFMEENTKSTDFFDKLQYTNDEF